MKTATSDAKTLSEANPPKQKRKAYHVAWCGRESVSVYKRVAPNGSRCFMVVNYAGADGKRRFDSYADGKLAIEAAGKLARQMSERQVLAAGMTNTQAGEYAAIVQTLAPFNISLLSAADTLAEALKLLGDLANVLAAAKDYSQRRKKTTPKRVEDVVTELLAVKEARGGSKRYLQDLRSRLNRFGKSFQKEIGNVTTAEIQEWLDGQKKISPQSHVNFRRVIHLLFTFAVARGFAMDNPVDGCERVKVRNTGNKAVFTPAQFTRLLEAASPDFLPALAIGAFAGIRSAEIERLSWSDIDFTAKHIVVSAGNAKTASRRIVAMPDNLCAWLAPYASRTGKIWQGTHEDFYQAQQDTAAATEVLPDPLRNISAVEPVKWMSNALRSSYASYRFAMTNDAGRVAGECGNSAATIHKHYRELVTPKDAEKWFGIMPEQPANVLPVAIPA